MSAIERTGSYGSYWGNTYDSSNALTKAQEKVNAVYIYNYLSVRGWTLNAISGVLGNMQAESSINPGRWQSDSVGSTSNGYGLVQWTPATKYINWIGVSNDPSTMDNNLSRIEYEVANNIQWIATSKYNYSFLEFTQSTDSAYNLGMAFVTNYERPAEISTLRGTYAEEWYEYLSGYIPPVPPVTTTKKTKFKWVLYANKLRRKRK